MSTLFPKSAVNELSESLRDLFERMPYGVFAHVNGEFVYANDSFVRSLGLTNANELIGRSVLSIVVPEERDSIVDRIRRGRETGNSGSSLDIRCTRADGNVVTFESVGVVLDVANVKTNVIFAHDVTARLAEATALRQAEEQFRHVFEQAPIGMAVVGLDLHIVRANERLATMLGIPQQALAGMHVTSIAAMDAADHAFVSHVLDLVDASSADHVKHVRTSDGREIDLTLTATVVRDSTGAPLHFILKARDATEQLRAARVIAESEARYRTLANNLPNTVVLSLDTDLRCVVAEGAEVLSVMGYDRRSIVGKSLSDFITQANIVRLEQMCRAALAGASHHEDVLRSGRVFETHVNPTRDENGAIIGVTILAYDITEQRRLQDELRASEARLATLLANGGEAIVSVDLHGRITALNERARVSMPLLFGVPLDMNAPLAERLPAEQAQHFNEAMLRARQGQSWADERTFIDSDGKARHMIIARSPIIANDTVIGMTIAARDITERRETELALAHAEEQLRRLFDDAPIAIALQSVDGHYVRTNDAFRALLGYSEEELAKLTYTELTHPDDRAVDLTFAAALYADRNANNVRHKRYISKSGAIIDAELHVSILRDEAGVGIGSIAQIIDITERMRAERALQKSEALYRAFVEHIPNAIVVVFDHDLRYTHVEGEATLRERGLSAAGLVGKHLRDVTTPDSLARFESLYRAALAGDANTIEYSIDGITYEVRIGPIRGADGTVFAGIASLYDISAQKRIQAELAMQWQTIVQQAPMIVTIVDRSGKVRFLNRARAPLSPQSVVGHDFLKYILNETARKRIHDHLNTAFETGKRVSLEARIQLPHAGTRWYLVTIGPFAVDDNVDQALIIALDITDRRRTTHVLERMLMRVASPTEDALAAVATSFAEAFEPATAIVARRLDNATYELAETRSSSTELDAPALQLDSNALHKLSLYAHVVTSPSEIRELLGDEIADSSKAESFMSAPLIGANGRTIGIIAVISCERISDVSLAAQTLRMCASFAVTELERSRSAMEVAQASEALGRRIREVDAPLQAQLARLLSAFDHLPGMVGYWDREERCRFANQAYLEWFGVAPEQLLDQTMQSLLKDVYPRNAPYIRGALSGQVQSFERELRDANGQRRHAQAWYIPDIVDDEVRGFFAFVYDITKQKDAEMSARQAARVKDEFLANMSHEFRTPLNAILGMSDALLERVYGPLTDRQENSLTTINKSGQHLLALVNDILDLSRIEAGALTLHHRQIVVAPFVAECVAYIAEQAQAKGLGVSTHFDDRIATINADPRRLKQMLLNLLSNAVKFTAKGAIDISVSGDREKQLVYFSVKDTGVGIPEHRQHELFQPFVMIDGGSSRAQDGTGLGLALVKQLASLHGGTVSMQSKAGEGSQFTIALPLGQSDEGHAPAMSEPQLFADATTTRTRVLLVEDNEASIAMMRDYLAAKGFDVDVARSGEEALDLAARAAHEVVLMDVQLPGMSGLDCIRALRATPSHGQVPIIAVTAQAMPADSERCIAAGASAYMSKPVKLPMLVKAMRALIAARG